MMSSSTFWLTHFLMVSTVAAATTSHPRCDASRSGTNIIVSGCVADVCDVTSVAAASLPSLLQQQRIDIDVADSCPSDFDGTVVFGGALSLGHSDAWYEVSREQRRCLQLFAQLVNARGGLKVGSQRLAVHASFVGDGSSLTQVTGALAHASRDGLGAHFLLGPFGSSLTKYAAKQALAEDKVLMAMTASTPSVIADNSLTFGVMPPSPKEIQATARALLTAAARCDATDAAAPPSHPCSALQRQQRCARRGGVAGSCTDALLAGFVVEDATYTSVMCASGPGTLTSLGFPYATEAGGQALSRTVSSGPGSMGGPGGAGGAAYTEYVEELAEALRPMQAANVTVILGCTYYVHTSTRVSSNPWDWRTQAPLLAPCVPHALCPN